MQYTIGELSKQRNIPASTLRYYDKEGLLPCMKRTDGGNRIFDDETLARLSIVECLKKTGLSIKDIKAFIDWCEEGDSTIDDRLQLFLRQREAVLAQINQLKCTLQTIDYKIWYYETAKAAGTCDVHNQMSEADIPEKFRCGYRCSKDPAEERKVTAEACKHTAGT